MSRRRFTGEQIIGLLGEAEVRLSRGRTVCQACREMGIPEADPLSVVQRIWWAEDSSGKEAE